ncbi:MULTISPECIES: YdaS family helix-turn-helix protein [Burkholderia cepacia complex]|uniref:YdaS family helix-turn-helix protein n=1 Tax=Burkholderia cepacia complex TaxID=87882 RepID=UPI001CF56B03|nr:MULTISPECIES: YdaS family helix-turn-helix protein [Burkholderia cepacia complex]MCA8323259.1 helix-turn-helix domain-containing protein [Burkholderia cepacia]MDN7848100.1 YdaS family helix-turn-helix protein [Burkholderia seminalis]
MDDAPILDQAIKRAGGAAAVARAFGISPVSVGEWLKKQKLPADRVIPVSGLTDWEYTPHMLDSKLYPNERDGMPLSLQPAQVAA